MKKIIKAFAFAAVVAVTLSACNKEQEVINSSEPQEYVYTFTIGDDTALTRAILDSDENGRFAAWESGDLLGSITPGTDKYSTITPASGETPASFTIKSSSALTAGQTITVWFPYDLYGTAQTNASSVALKIPSVQHHLANGKFDIDAMPMVAKQIVVDETIAAAYNGTKKEVVIPSINFANLGSVINFKVFSSVENTYEKEKVQSITFNASGNIGGTFTKNLATINPDEETPSTMLISSFDSPVTSIVTKPYAPAAIGTTKESALDLYMVIAPGDFSGSIVVRTNAADYTFSLTSARTFARSGFKAFGLDLNSVNAVRTALPPTATTWTLTDMKDLAPNDIIVIVDATSQKAMSNNKGTSNPPEATSVTISSNGNNITSEVGATIQWVLESPEMGVYQFKVPNTSNYLYCTATNNGVRVGTNANNKFSYAYYYSKGNYDGYFLNNNAVSRFVGPYSDQDWRCYETINNNIKASNTVFYKKTTRDLPSHTITINNTVPANGFVSTDPSGSAYETATVAITLAPETGCEAQVFTVMAGGSAVELTAVDATHYTFEMPAADVSITTTFTKKSAVSIVYGTTPAHGAISIDPASPVFQGTEVTISEVSHDTGYALSSLTAKDAGNNDITITNNKFTMPGSAVTVTATFAAVPTINMLKTEINSVPAAGVSGATEEGVYQFLNNASDASVTVTYDGTVVISASKSNGNIVYTVSANTQAARSGWIKVQYGTEDPHTVTVSQLVATYTLAVASGDNGTITATVGNTTVAEGQNLSVAYGTEITLAQEAAKDYAFDAWNVYNTGTPATKIMPNDQGKFNMPAYGVTVSAAFKEDVKDWSSTYSSNITLPTSGTQASSCSISIGSTSYSGTKLGKSGGGGSASFTALKGTRYIHLHVAAWKDKSPGFTYKVGSGTAQSISGITSNSGIANNSPFTWGTGNSDKNPNSTDHYKVIDLGSALESDTSITFASTNDRVVFWGVNTTE